MRALIIRLVTIAVLASSMGGCYLGHSRGGKTIAYAANGTMLAVGLGGVVDSSNQHNEEAGLAGMISAAPLIAGLVGIALNLATSTEPYPSQPQGAPQKTPASDFTPRSR